MLRIFTDKELDKLKLYIPEDDTDLTTRLEMINDLQIDNYDTIFFDLEEFKKDTEKYHKYLMYQQKYSVNKITQIFNAVAGVDLIYESEIESFNSEWEKIKSGLVTLNNQMKVRDYESPRNCLMRDSEFFNKSMNKTSFKDEYKLDFDFKYGVKETDLCDRLIIRDENIESSLQERKYLGYEIVKFTGLLSRMKTKKGRVGYIPQVVSDETVMYVMTALSKPLLPEDIKRHYYSNLYSWKNEKNKKVTAEDYIFDGKYIDNQGVMSYYFFGMDEKYENDITADYNSCEIIALYNAFVSLGDDCSKYEFPSLLAEFENRGLSRYGAWGTSPHIVEKYLEDEGYEYKSLLGKHSKNKQEVDTLENEYDTFIITAYNDKDDIDAFVHTMSITKENGGFYIHNDYASKGKYNSLYDSIIDYKDGNSQVINIIGIKRKDN